MLITKRVSDIMMLCSTEKEAEAWNRLLHLSKYSQVCRTIDQFPPSTCSVTIVIVQ